MPFGWGGFGARCEGSLIKILPKKVSNAFRLGGLWCPAKRNLRPRQSIWSPMPFGWGGFGAVHKSALAAKMASESPMPFGWGGFGAPKKRYCNGLKMKRSPMPFGWGGFGASVSLHKQLQIPLRLQCLSAGGALVPRVRSPIIRSCHSVSNAFRLGGLWCHDATSDEVFEALESPMPFGWGGFGAIAF